MESRIAPVITNIVVMGDSLSDRGTLKKRKLFGFIPMSLILFFSAHQNKGRFTNAMTWDDDLGTMLAGKFIASAIDHKSFPHLIADKKSKPHLDQEAQDAADVSDMVLTHSPESQPLLHNPYTLKNDVMIPYQGAAFVRTHAEGGMTAHDWKHEPGGTFAEKSSRKILRTLDDIRDDVFREDEKRKISGQQKKESLVIEWSGGNDLITVNSRPTVEEADKVVAARIKNIEEMIKKGYTNFVLFDMPDLSLTPRFQARSPAERDAASEVCKYLNARLEDQRRELLQKYPNAKIELFEISKIFNSVHANPHDYGFTNTNTPFIQSDAYKKHRKDPVLPSKGYMFWDDIHPTGHMHALLAEKFQERFGQKFDFQPPKIIEKGAQHYYEQFMRLYNKQTKSDRNSLFGCMRRFNLKSELHKEVGSFHGEGGADEQFQKGLAVILNHGLNHKGYRTRKLLLELGWIDKNGVVNVAIPELHAALDANDALRVKQEGRIRVLTG